MLEVPDLVTSFPLSPELNRLKRTQAFSTQHTLRYKGGGRGRLTVPGVEFPKSVKSTLNTVLWRKILWHIRLETPTLNGKRSHRTPVDRVILLIGFDIPESGVMCGNDGETISGMSLNGELLAASLAPDVVTLALPLQGPLHS